MQPFHEIGNVVSCRLVLVEGSPEEQVARQTAYLITVCSIIFYTKVLKEQTKCFAWCDKVKVKLSL
jgi:hypothetical protein